MCRCGLDVGVDAVDAAEEADALEIEDEEDALLDF
jgi:hypothetical protein